nr:hypothetical protein CFP56_66937 [Quercus suber]
MPPPLFSKPTCFLLVIIIAVISIPTVRLPSDLCAISIPTLVTHAASPLALDHLAPTLSHRTKPPWYRSKTLWEYDFVKPIGTRILGLLRSDRGYERWWLVAVGIGVGVGSGSGLGLQ